MEVQYPRKVQNHEIHEIQKSRRNESPKSQLNFCSFFRQFNEIQNQEEMKVQNPNWIFVLSSDNYPILRL